MALRTISSKLPQVGVPGGNRLNLFFTNRKWSSTEKEGLSGKGNRNYGPYLKQEIIFCHGGLEFESLQKLCANFQHRLG